MKHHIRDILILLISYLGLAFLYRWYISRRGPLVRILCFHDVPDAAWFEEIVAMLVREYVVITPAAFHTQKFVPEKINILFTFDDGYQSWVDVCLPVMERYGVKGIFFINSGLLDCADDAQTIAAYMHERLLLGTVRQPLTWDGARALVAIGHTIGGHTYSHQRLPILTLVEAEIEIQKDKQLLESKLDIVLRDFAYPYGRVNDFTNKVTEVVKVSGYTFIYTAVSAFSNGTPINVGRTLIEKQQSFHSLRCWLGGSYDIISAIKHAVWK